MSPRSPRRILMTADTVGGVWTYAVDLAGVFARRGIEVVLATMGDPMSEDQLDQVDALGIRAHEGSFKLEWMPDAWADVDLAGRWLLELAARERVDLVHLNGFAHAALDWPVPAVVVAHSCVVSWWRAVYGCDPPPEWDEYRRRVTAGLAAADLVVAPTAAMLRVLEDAYLPLPAARVIHNARAPRRSRRLPRGPLVLSAGRLWDEAKNLAALDRAAASIPWPVAVAGAWRHPDGRAVRARRLELLGALSPAELADWMARASIYAAPARYEPFGLAALEAALAGCALVLGDIPSLREVWDDAALYVPPDDHAALAHAIRSLIADPAARSQAAAAARARALTYDIERTADGYLAAYRDAARQPPLAAAAT